MSPLPNFLIIGAQKSGTSWLQHTLAQHPDVYLPPLELHFFDWAHHYARGLAWYEAQFSGWRGERAIGEKTPEYLQTNVRLLKGHRPDTHLTIHELLPGVRLVVVLRDPVDRAASSARHLVHTHRVPPRTDLDALLSGHLPELRHLYNLTLSYGFYHERLVPFVELFGLNRILVLIYEEDVRDDPAAGLARTCRFLGVDPSFRFEDLGREVNTFRKSQARLLLEYHATPLKRVARRLDRYLPPWRWEPSPETTNHLRDVYASDVAALARLLGRPLPWPS